MLVYITIILLFIAIFFSWKWWLITKEMEELRASMYGVDDSDKVEWHAV